MLAALRLVIIASTVILLTVGAISVAQNPPSAQPNQGESSLPRPQNTGPASQVTDPSSESKPEQRSLLGIMAEGGIVGVLIILLSIAAMALGIEQILALRSGVLIPAGLGERVQQLLLQGQLAQADQQCKLQPSSLSKVLEAGIAEAEAGWPAVEKAMEDALADQAGRLLRRIDYFSVIGNIAPMLGLLGTVVGMIEAFRQVAQTQGAARAADLADGIYLALVTTVEGLVVAIPALAAFAFFRNLADQLIGDVGAAATAVFAPLRRRRASRPASPA